MKIRVFLVLTGIVSALLGALIVYLVLSVPNDLRADALLQQAHQNITGGNATKGRESLVKLVQQYPRTDAAAAATAALLSLEKKERDELARAVSRLASQNVQQTKLIVDLQKTVEEIKNAPPKVVTVQAPAPKPSPPKKKRAPKPPTRRRR